MSPVGLLWTALRNFASGRATITTNDRYDQRPSSDNDRVQRCRGGLFSQPGNFPDASELLLLSRFTYCCRIARAFQQLASDW